MTPADDGPRSPFEQLFAALAAGTGQPGGTPDLGALFGQLQRMFTPHEGSVNWELARDIARSTAAQASDPSPSTADQQAVSEAVRLAELWLDDACTLPAAATAADAWSRAEWVESTLPAWQRLIEPVAAHVATAMRDAMPAEAAVAAGPLLGMLGQAGGAMFGAQVGQAIGGLATEVVSACEIGLPLAPAGRAAIVLANTRAFGHGLGIEEADVLLYVALRECAYQRLFDQVSWLPGRLFGTVEEYARGMSIDTSAFENTLTNLDPGNLEALQEAVGEGLFEPERTPEQLAALERLETLLALVEGWVDEVVTRAAGSRLPAAPALQEAVRRRRAAGGPAEQTFASLVGLELRPRRLRDAAALWGALRAARGDVARDGVWAHPDLLPSAEDLDDPLAFAERDALPASVETQDFDAALSDLLQAPDPTSSDEHDGHVSEEDKPPSEDGGRPAT